MSNKKYCIIVAGGVGARLWPKSQSELPKQFLDLLGSGKSLLRHTFERFLPMMAVEDFIVVTNSRYRDLVLEHIPELSAEQVLCEPVGRNTAPAIAYVAHRISKSDPQAKMVVTPADHYVADDAEFREDVKECFEYVYSNDKLITLGVRPTRPETAYGYIQRSCTESISRVKCFTEKPDVELAQTFLQCGEFYWNTGIVVGSAAAFVESIDQYLPEMGSLFHSIEGSLCSENEAKAIESIYSECRVVSFDNGVLECAEEIYMYMGEFEWSDVGTWGSVYQHSRKDKYANVASSSEVIPYDTRGTIVSLPDGKMAIISGLKDYIVVDSDGVLMICPRSEELNVKKFADEVKFVKQHGGGDQSR